MNGGRHGDIAVLVRPMTDILSFTDLDAEGLVQIGLAILLGGVIGFERELRGRAAGLRTMILVCLGSTVVMMVSVRLSTEPYESGMAEVIRVDPGRIAAGIVTGIGFLGAGVILKIGDLIRGVTTGATIWFVAAVGIAIGDRRYLLAGAATAVALIVLAVLQIPERYLKSYIYRTVTLTVRSPRTPAALDEARSFIEERGMRIMDLRAVEDVEQATSTVHLHVRTYQELQGHEIIARLSAVDGVVRAVWE